MAEQVYIYSLQGPADELRQKADTYLGTPVWHWVADPARLDVGEGLPETWEDQGAVFNERGELRWWRQNGVYEALLVTEEPVEGLEPLPGTWWGETQHLFLQDLRERRVNPNFSTYPDGKTKGRIEACVCYRDGVAMLVSLRKFVQTSEVSGLRKS
ncbi:MAG TPA: hypothetical protein G4O02_11470 [Caldilineae bacterium]|jgi:hypothetical protein|nr:hypothetical protein [Caldilineae bacterium]